MNYADVFIFWLASFTWGATLGSAWVRHDKARDEKEIIYTDRNIRP